MFLVKPFCYMIKKSRQKPKNLEDKKSFWSKNNYEKCFSFHLQSCFRSRDIQIFVFLTFPQFFPVSHWLRRWFKINLKFYDVNICLNKNLITFVWYLEKEKTYDIETLSIDRLLHKEHFHGKIMKKLWTESQSRTPS